MRNRCAVASLLVLSVVMGSPLWAQEGAQPPPQEPVPDGAPAPEQEPEDGPPAVPAEGEPATQPSPAAQPGLRDTAGAVAGGVVSAARDTAGAMQEGGAEVARQGRALWEDVFLPMWQRTAAALPVLVKAVLLLLVFWIAALLLAAAVRKLLGMTRLDDRAAEAWGLGPLLKTKDGKERSIEQVAGTAVKWLVLLFGFVAFFQALNLSMVAGPLEGIIGRILGVVPNLLQAAAILFVYWVLASLLRLAASRGLGALGFDEKAKRFIPEREVKGEKLGPSALVGRLLFYLVLIFGLPPFLDALGQRSLVAPLSEMLEKALAFLPNLLGAVVVLLLGHLVATVVREVLTNFLAAAGLDAGVRKLGLGEALQKLKVSEIAGSIAYFFIIIPVIAAGVESLQIRAVSEPVSRTLETLLAAVPLVFVALLVIAVGYYLAHIVRRIVESFLSGVGFDTLPEKLGLGFLGKKEDRLAPSAVAGTAIMLVIILLTAEQALATLQLVELSELVGRLLAFLPQLLVGLVLILAAWSLSAYAARVVASTLGETGQGRVLTHVTRYAILVFGAALALGELGIGEQLISVTVAAVLGGAALALGLAFGLGGRERAKELIERN